MFQFEVNDKISEMIEVIIASVRGERNFQTTVKTPTEMNKILSNPVKSKNIIVLDDRIASNQGLARYKIEQDGSTTTLRV
jgi:hypothetical protein